MAIGMRPIDARNDLPALRAKYEAAMQVFEEANKAIVNRPAESAVGVAVKLAHAHRAYADDEVAEPLSGALCDAIKLAGLDGKAVMPELF